jgi:hypothetical protein
MHILYGTPPETKPIAKTMNLADDASAGLGFLRFDPLGTSVGLVFLLLLFGRNLFADLDIFLVLSHNLEASHGYKFVGSFSDRLTDPTIILHDQVSDNRFLATLNINDESSIQIQTFNDNTRSTDNQRRSTTDLDLFWEWELDVVFTRTAGKVGLQNDARADSGSDAAVGFWLGIFDMTTSGAHHDTLCGILVRFAREGSSRGRTLFLEGSSVRHGVLDGRKAQFSCNLCEADHFAFVLIQNGWEVLHHAFKTGWLLEDGLLNVRVLWVDKVRHDTLGSFENLVVFFDAEEELVDVSRERRESGLLVIDVSILEFLSSTQHGVELIVFHIDSSETKGKQKESVKRTEN